MFKFLAIAFALVVLGYFIARPFLQGQSRSRKGNKAKNEVIEEMQECATCGTYIATDEALLSQGRYFCSIACREKHA